MLSITSCSICLRKRGFVKAHTDTTSSYFNLLEDEDFFLNLPSESCHMTTFRKAALYPPWKSLRSYPMWTILIALNPGELVSTVRDKQTHIFGVWNYQVDKWHIFFKRNDHRRYTPYLLYVVFINPEQEPLPPKENARSDLIILLSLPHKRPTRSPLDAMDRIAASRGIQHGFGVLHVMGLRLQSQKAQPHFSNIRRGTLFLMEKKKSWHPPLKIFSCRSIIL